MFWKDGVCYLGISRQADVCSSSNFWVWIGLVGFELVIWCHKRGSEASWSAKPYPWFNRWVLWWESDATAPFDFVVVLPSLFWEKCLQYMTKPWHLWPLWCQHRDVISAWQRSPCGPGCGWWRRSLAVAPPAALAVSSPSCRAWRHSEASWPAVCRWAARDMQETHREVSHQGKVSPAPPTTPRAGEEGFLHVLNLDYHVSGFLLPM